MANAWASHGALKTGPASSQGNAGKAVRSSGSFGREEVMSGSPDARKVEIGFPAIDADRCRCRIRPPEFGGIEAHGIEPLRLFAEPDRVGIGKNVRAVHCDDVPPSAAAIARQTGMRGWIQLERYCAGGKLSRAARDM